MREFKDATGQQWSVVINGATIKRAQDLLRIDLGDPLAGDPPVLTRIDTDIVFMVDLIYVVCKPEADLREISDVQFAERLEGDALHAAHDAVLEELADFFQKLRRSHLAGAIEKQQEVVRRALELVDRTIRSPALTSRLDHELDELGKSCASLLGSSEPIPSAAPSES